MRFLSGFMAAGAVGLSLAFTAPAWALSSGDNFSVTQNCGTAGIGSVCSESGATLTDVDRVNFTYTARIEQANDGSGPGGVLDGDPFTEKGFANWTGYINDSDGAVFGSTLNTDYQVYMVFEATGTATVVGGGIKATFATFTIDIYISDDGNTSLSLPATNAGSVLNGGFAIGSGLGPNADDNLIATATLLAAGEANLNAGLANGDYEVVLSDLGLSLFGASFLSNPDPFYSLMHFAGNTGTVFPAGSATAPFNAQATGDGQLFFTVPEPGTLGLLGGGLLGAAAFLRRRKAAKAA